MLDRIDIHIEVPRVECDKLTEERQGESSATIRERVEAAREVQQARFEGSKLLSNADMGPAEVRKCCTLDEAGRSLVRTALQQLQLSACALHRILKLAQPMADPEGAGDIQTQHLSEAIQHWPRQELWPGLYHRNLRYNA